VGFAVEHEPNTIALVDLANLTRLPLPTGVQPTGVTPHHPERLGVVVAAAGDGLDCTAKAGRLVVFIVLRHHDLPAPHALTQPLRDKGVRVTVLLVVDDAVTLQQFDSRAFAFRIERDFHSHPCACAELKLLPSRTVSFAYTLRLSMQQLL
jgi:hypothetical protein